MYKKINKNKLGVIEYSIDTEEDLDDIKFDNVDNTVYATMNSNGKELIYLYSSYAKKWILINDVQVELNSINEQLDTKANKDEIGQPTQEQVDNWLNNNPQATTTVKDNSITDKKIYNKSELYKISEVIKENCKDNLSNDNEYLIGLIDSGKTAEANGSYGFTIPFICNDIMKEYDSFIIKNIEVNVTEDIVLTFAIKNYSTGQYYDGSGDLFSLNKTINLSGQTSLEIDLSTVNWGNLNNSDVYMFVVCAKSIDGSSFILLNQHYTNIENKTDNIFNVDFNNYKAQGFQKRTVGGKDYLLQVNLISDTAPFVGFIKKGEIVYNYNKIFEQKSIPLYGKKIAFLGDSLTWGFNGAVAWQQVQKPISVLVAEFTGGTCINNGISGSTLAGDGVTKHEDGHTLGVSCMNLRIENIDNVDCIFVMGGTNDYATDRSVPLGQMGDTTNLTFYGALDKMIQYIGNNKPTIRLVFATPPRRANMAANGYGNTLEEYANAVKEVCKKYGVYCIDLFNESNCLYWSSEWRKIYSPDGLHGTQSLYDIYAKIIANHLISIL